MLKTADGKIFILVYDNGYTKLAKYLSNGQLDLSFAKDGFSDPVRMVGNDVVMQGTKILVAGWSNFTSFGLARYTADGTLDYSFGTHGVVLSAGDEAYNILLQGNKIVLVGPAHENFRLARYTADGIPDSSFGVNGIVTTGFGNTSAMCYSAVLQGDKIIAAGTNYDYEINTGYFALARYTADGALDQSFGRG